MYCFQYFLNDKSAGELCANPVITKPEKIRPRFGTNCCWLSYQKGLVIENLIKFKTLFIYFKSYIYIKHS